jgi:hypothetical protein
MTRQAKEKCITCKHPLEEHTKECCLHYHTDIKRLCKCKEGNEGVMLNKKYVNIKVLDVLWTGDNFVMFKSNEGKVYRWMHNYKQLFPVEI